MTATLLLEVSSHPLRKDTMRFDAVTPDGQRLHFDDFIYPGDVVHDNHGSYYVVGPDLGDEDPRLLPMDHEHYRLWWRKLNPHVAHLWEAPCR